VSVTKAITRLDKSNVKLSLTIPKDDVLSQYQNLLKDYSKNVQIAGFRKGKVPQEVLERKFGEALKGEALGKIMEKAIEEVFDDNGLPADERPLAYSRPEIEEEPTLDFDKDLCFSLIYDVLPKVTVGQWKGLTADVPDVVIDEEDITRDLEEVRERNSVVIDRDEGAAAQSGDVVTVDYCELGEADEEIPHSDRKDFAFTLGTNMNAYQLDDDIIGMKKGETKVVQKSFPSDGPDDDSLLAGKNPKLRVTLKTIKEKKLPDLDDELAQDVDEKFKTLADLKKNIRERLEKSLTLRMKDIKVSNLLEKIMENTPVILPESMIRVEIEGRLRNMARQFGIEPSQLLQMMAGKDGGLQEIEGRMRPQAEKALHSRLIVEAIMEAQGIEASEADIEKELENIAVDAKMPLEDVRKRYGEGNALEYIRDSIRETKVFDLLLAENTIKTGSRVKYLDFMGKND